MKDSGFYIFKNGPWKLVVDAGQPGPAYIPGHAHCDAMSYELFKDGKPVLMNCGTYVKKQARGQGISTCLIAEMLCVLRNEKGIQTFFTAINSRNASSIRSFEKNGFKLIGHVRAIEKVLTSDFDTEFNERFKKNKKKVEA